MASAIKIHLPASLLKEDVEAYAEEAIDKVLRQHGERFDDVGTIERVKVDPIEVFKEEVQTKLFNTKKINWKIDDERAYRIFTGNPTEQELEALEQESIKEMHSVMETASFFVASGIVEILALPPSSSDTKLSV